MADIDEMDFEKIIEKLEVKDGEYKLNNFISIFRLHALEPANDVLFRHSDVCVTLRELGYKCDEDDFLDSFYI